MKRTTFLSDLVPKEDAGLCCLLPHRPAQVLLVLLVMLVLLILAPVVLLVLLVMLVLAPMVLLVMLVQLCPVVPLLVEF